MQRTILGGGQAAGRNHSAAAKERMAAPKWCAPRISMADSASFVGRDVTFVGEAEELDLATGTATLRCICSSTRIRVVNLPSNTELSKLNELTIFIESPDQPVVYVSHGMLNDDFSEPIYQQLVRLISTHHRDLFY
jgi:hypothetical protein